MTSEVTHKNQVLTKAQIDQKIKRIAFEIYENNFKEKTIIIGGISGQGYTLAELIADELRSISPLEVQLVMVTLDKMAPSQSEVTIDCDEKMIRKKCVILVDDVLNTGKTVAFGMKPFLNVELKKIEVAVLVNRSHTLFPILTTYTGLELSTTLNEHVEVVLGKKAAVYLR